MTAEKFQNKYRLKSARAEWHDYGGGAYFATVCTKQREHFFGEIVDAACRDVACRVSTLEPEQMKFTKIGEFLNEKIKNINTHCSYCEIPLYVVMPNHWHAIVFIDGDKTPYIRRDMTSCTTPTVETRHATSLQSAYPQQQTENGKMQNIANQQGWLSVAIGGIKSAITKFANENKIDFAWQTRFHDHIIRDTTEMNRIADYIENNPDTWDTDCFNE
jgi:REP element-mobilizing transposase RayT